MVQCVIGMTRGHHMSIRLYFMRASVAAVLFGGVSGLAPGAAAHDLKLAIFFKVVSSGPGKGAFPAHLVWNKGQISGTISVRAGQKYPCTVLSGSTDIDYTLKMTCSIENGVDLVTFDGKLNLLTGKGHGTVSDTLYGETGTYTSHK